MEFTAKDVQHLRELTNAGMMDCKKALTETNGDVDAAIKWLREHGMAQAAKRAGRIAAEGAVTSYIHMGGKIGVLIEVNCETDFAARSEPFQTFCKHICFQVCSASPRWIDREDVPQSEIESEKAIYRVRAKETGKPEKILDKIAEGMLSKWFKEVCLMQQDSVMDTEGPKRTIEEVTKELSGTLGEKIQIRRFVRFQLGEGIEKPKADLAKEVAQAVAASKGS
jgi:elongation factor Ts